jgi:hypothetical protein
LRPAWATEQDRVSEKGKRKRKKREGEGGGVRGEGKKEEGE